MTTRAANAYVSDNIRVENGDNPDMPDCLILSIGPNEHDPDVALTVIEITRDEARDIIAGLAAVL